MKESCVANNFETVARIFGSAVVLVLMMMFTQNCKGGVPIAGPVQSNEFLVERDAGMQTQSTQKHLTLKHSVRDVVDHPAFKGFGELLLPWEDNTRYYDTRLDQVGTLMPYHGHVNGTVVVDALNHLIDETGAGKTVFYNFYTDLQKQDDPAKKHTGLFFYRGKPGAPFAIVSPGGGFSYVGSLHEGFPLAQQISEKGLNAFVIRYRVGEREATEDLAAAIAYVFRNAEALRVSTPGYSLWGGSAGARMVGNIALGGVARFGGGAVQKPAAVIIAYTGQSSYSAEFPPTFLTVSEDDRIASVGSVDARAKNLERAGVQVEFRRYKNAGHGFGLGTGTDAEGWMDHAVKFWKSQLSKTL